MKKRLANLLSVKSIVTIIATGAMVFGFVMDRNSAEQFMMVYSSIIAFYFGTQSQKNQDALDNK